uniref:Ribonuclease H-like domain-containing protein n=1 Tax=Tanacetum cinerariifolium TaxID=118510 RepID=A0A699I2R7_TANCI|nr:ribonuclease H-like domain-containing protein [Tanacetum cinerariifolium]
MAGDDENATNLPPVPPTLQAPHTISTIKLPVLKKGEYDIWAMKLEHYLDPIDYPIWEVVQKRNGLVQVSTYTNGQIRVLPPKIAEEILARERKKSKKFQSLLSQLEIHGVGVSIEDAIQKFLRFFESGVKGSTASSSSTQNVAFVSSNNTNSTNEVSTTYGVSTSFGHNSQKEGSLSYIDYLMYSFFFNQSSSPQLDHEDLESKGNQESRRRDPGNTRYKARDNGRRPAKQDEHKAMVTINEEGVDWTGHAKDDTKNYALMAFNSSNSGSDTEEWESDSEEDEIMVKPKEVTKTVKPSFEKIESVNARNETVRQAENPRKKQ